MDYSLTLAVTCSEREVNFNCLVLIQGPLLVKTLIFMIKLALKCKNNFKNNE